MSEFEDLKQKIDFIDLEPIVFSLIQRDDGPKWTLSKARQIETWYRRYLILCGLHLDEDIIPTKDVDLFWHTHILDTMKYMEDCNDVFGFYLHHFPYIGLRSKNDLDDSKKAFGRTLELFNIYFKDSPLDFPSNCGSRCGGHIIASSCGGGEGDDDRKISTHICNYRVRPTLDNYLKV